jgi:uncharacterized protein
MPVFDMDDGLSFRQESRNSRATSGRPNFLFKETEMTYQPEEEQQRQGRLPVCPLCGGDQFSKEEGRLDSKWGFTSHKMILLICEQCQLVLHFYNGNSIFDFD